MAVQNQLASTLRLVLSDGIDADSGKPVYHSKSFSNIKVSSDATQLFNVAEQLASLQTLPLDAIERRDTSEISEA